jgi:hypothetical protein
VPGTGWTGTAARPLERSVCVLAVTTGVALVAVDSPSFGVWLAWASTSEKCEKTQYPSVQTIIDSQGVVHDPWASVLIASMPPPRSVVPGRSNGVSVRDVVEEPSDGLKIAFRLFGEGHMRGVFEHDELGVR